MPIPDYQSLMLPVLQEVSDQKEHRFQDVTEAIAKKLKLTEAELRELLPSGLQPIFRNRVAWAKTYLKKAGLLVSPQRGVIAITPTGIRVLEQRPERIDVRFLREFPEFLNFFKLKSEDKQVPDEVEMGDEIETPEELIEANHFRLREELSEELLKNIMNSEPAFFERLVVELLVKMGYGGSLKEAAGQVVGKSGDEGIDGIIKEDKLGLDVIYIQAKRWDLEKRIGRQEIQKFVGALAGQGARKGVFITTAGYTREARDYAPKNDTKIVLIDGVQLAELMIEHDLGVYTQHTYQIKKLDLDYFGFGEGSGSGA